MTVTNLDRDPNCYKSRRYTWGASQLGQQDDRHWMFGDRGNSYVGLLHENWDVAQGNVVVAYLEFGTTVSKISMMGAKTTLLTEINDTHVLLVGTDITGTPQVCINGLVSCTPLYAGIFTPADWEQLKSLYDKGTLTGLLWVPPDAATLEAPLPPQFLTS